MKKLGIAICLLGVFLQLAVVGLVGFSLGSWLGVSLAAGVLLCLLSLICLFLNDDKQELELPKEQEVETPARPEVIPEKAEDKKEENIEEYSYFEKYLEYVKDKNGNDASRRVKKDIEALLGSGVGKQEHEGRINEIVEREDKNNRVNGLVVGRVQAGKTQNYTGLITKAIDQKWNVIIVLTSNNTALANQTRQRLKNDLEKSGLENSKYEFIENFCVGRNQLPEISLNKIYVGVALKQPDHLQGRDSEGGRETKGICGFLKKNENVLRYVSVLIIDDEADNCSLNTNVGQEVWDEGDVRACADKLEARGERAGEWVRSCLDLVFDAKNQRWKDLSGSDNCCGAFTIDDAKRIVGEDSCFKEILGLDNKIQPFVCDYFASELRTAIERKELQKIIGYICKYKVERSRVNDAICYIVGRTYNEQNSPSYNIGRLAYIGYTATPYGVLLNEKRNGANPLQLDFIQSMQTAPEYFGLNKIFGDYVATTGPRMPIIKDVYVNGAFKVDELNNAIAWAFCTAAIRRTRRLARGNEGRSERWTTMLVNISRRIGDHNKLADNIREKVQQRLASGEVFKKSCQEIFNKYSADVTADWFKNEYPDYDLNRCLITDTRWDEVEKSLEWFIEKERCNVIAMNSGGENQENYNWYVQGDGADKIEEDCLWIVVGGNKISRGLTFDGLTVSYFDRDKASVTVDTLTQMGRWFGYRVGYELLPRVWMPKDTVGVMKKICRLENDMHEQIWQTFETEDDDLNIRMKDICKRLTGRDKAAVRSEAICSPFVTRILPYPQGDGVAQSATDFHKLINGYFDVYNEYNGQRWHYWHNVRYDKVAEYVVSVWNRNLISEYEFNRLKDVFTAIINANVFHFDVVLANPKNACDTFDFAGSEIHPHGTECAERVDGNLIRFEKFSGQVDAWKAGVDVDIIKEVQEELGVDEKRVNTAKALKRVFEKVEERAGKNPNPIFQLGFIEHKEGEKRELLLTIAIYWPLHDIIVDATIGNAPIDELPVGGQQDKCNHESKEGGQQPTIGVTVSKVGVGNGTERVAVSNCERRTESSENSDPIRITDTPELKKQIRGLFENVRLMKAREFQRQCAQINVRHGSEEVTELCGSFCWPAGTSNTYYYLKSRYNNNVMLQIYSEIIKQWQCILRAKDNHRGKTSELWTPEIENMYAGAVKLRNLLLSDDKDYRSNQSTPLRRLRSFNIEYEGKEDGCHMYRLNENDM